MLVAVTLMRRVKVCVYARDEFVGAYVREQLQSLQGIEVALPLGTPIEASLIETEILTEGERRVLEAFTRCDTVRQASRMLYLSENTVRTHLKNIYNKLHVHSLHRALMLALEWGLINRRDTTNE